MLNTGCQFHTVNIEKKPVPDRISPRFHEIFCHKIFFCNNKIFVKSELKNRSNIIPINYFFFFYRIQKRLVRLTRAVSLGQFNKKRNEACDMLIAIDEPLYVTYNRDLRNLTKMVQLYVKQLNEIYHRYVQFINNLIANTKITVDQKI